MYQMSVGRMEVEVKLEPGIYRSGIHGATGKTYLYNLARSKACESDEVVAVTYEDIVGMEKLREKGSKAKLIVVDRYELYKSKELRQMLEQYAEHAIVLVDTKQTYLHGLAHFELSDGRLEIVGC